MRCWPPEAPWNPNKIEQRFGRIHRIGQTEVCHLRNLIAADTREGEVYGRLLEKLEIAREALGGRVYDVLGELFEGTALKDLLFQAIQYGEQEDVRARLFQQVDGAVDQTHLLELLRRRALTNDTMPEARVEELRLDMERAEALRLQPHHIQSFFVEAFQHLGGRLRLRIPGASGFDRLEMRDMNIQAVACPKGMVKGQAGDVRIFEIEHIKGLEFEAVFFTDIDTLKEREPDLFDRYVYVGATRAATFLRLMCSGEGLPCALESVVNLFEERWP